MTEYASFDAVALMQTQRTEQIIDAFITETVVTVRSRTPIKTGTARAGWERFPEGMSILGTTQYVFNNVDYIVLLEYGHSQQAPEGMARITAAESQERMDAIVARFAT